jgi:hypothetical protein
MSLARPVINKLMLARHLFRMAEDNLRSHREVALFAAVNLMQDAVEVFLLAAAEQVHAPIALSTNFDTYMTKIDAKIEPNQLPFRARLNALNKARVNAKHYGLKPDRKEIEGFATDCRAFFEGSCSLLFGQSFWSISLLDLVEDGDTRQLLANATILFESGDYRNCLIECRKVMFVKFEADYDIEKFREPQGLGLFSGFSKAPYYTRNKEYIDKEVKEPFDYIQFDHQMLTSDLMADSIDPQVFWNVLRLTPAVYRHRKDGKSVSGWLIKRDLQKEQAASEDHAAYVLDQAIDMVLTLEHRHRLLRTPGSGRFYIRLKREGVSLYQRADRNSSVACVTPAGVLKLHVESSVPGLNDDATYWHAVDFYQATKPIQFLIGYVHEDDVDWSGETAQEEDAATE